jgi:hypothetical protein
VREAITANPNCALPAWPTAAHPAATAANVPAAAATSATVAQTVVSNACRLSAGRRCRVLVSVDVLGSASSHPPSTLLDRSRLRTAILQHIVLVLLLRRQPRPTALTATAHKHPSTTLSSLILAEPVSPGEGCCTGAGDIRWHGGVSGNAQKPAGGRQEAVICTHNAPIVRRPIHTPTNRGHAASPARPRHRPPRFGRVASMVYPPILRA